jgi:DNA-binding transcriptional regulator YdaS (Cro superfamily)
MHFNAMPVVIRGTVYSSHQEAAQAMGVTPSAISQRLRVKGSADTVGLGLGGGVPGNTNAAKELTILGVTFPSRSQAAKDLGVSRSQLTKWIAPTASVAQRQMLLAALMKYRMQCAKR